MIRAGGGVVIEEWVDIVAEEIQVLGELPAVVDVAEQAVVGDEPAAAGRLSRRISTWSCWKRVTDQEMKR